MTRLLIILALSLATPALVAAKAPTPRRTPAVAPPTVGQVLAMSWVGDGEPLRHQLSPAPSSRAGDVDSFDLQWRAIRACQDQRYEAARAAVLHRRSPAPC